MTTKSPSPAFVCARGMAYGGDRSVCACVMARGGDRFVGGRHLENQAQGARKVLDGEGSTREGEVQGRAGWVRH
jgi:hypothetical protein